MQAVTRGWCSPKTSKKIMDSDLAMAITDEVILALKVIKQQERHYYYMKNRKK